MAGSRHDHPRAERAYEAWLEEVRETGKNTEIDIWMAAWDASRRALFDEIREYVHDQD